VAAKSISWRAISPLTFAVVLAVLLALLATLQWNWVGELSDAERHRMLANMAASGELYAADVEREILRLFFAFHPEPETIGRDPVSWLAERADRWQREAPYPQLLKQLVLVSPDGAACLPAEATQFTPCVAPAALAHAIERLNRTPDGDDPRPALPTLMLEVPALVLPARNPFDANAGSTFTMLWIELDRAAIVEDLLPEITSRYFGSEHGEDYAVAVVGGEPPELVYRSEPSWGLDDFSRADFRRPLLGAGPPGEEQLEPTRGRVAMRSRRGHPGWPRHSFAGHRHSERAGEELTLPRLPASGVRWTLVVKRRDRSVDVAVARFRFHNLGISLCILGLIGATAGTMALSARRAERLARQQLEFVAGVTHELHTPLTAIRSAGENLADGVVSSPEQVQRYGELVAREGRRLTDMVAQVLELAGIRSGRPVYRPQAVEVAEVVDGALAASAWLLRERGVELQRDIEADLPAIDADPAAVERALRNLIDNAVKYGGTERWVGVRARRSGDEVAIEVADRGAGIESADLSHLFEPFYRGRSVASSVPGSGLGLSLVRHVVEAHGGRVTVNAGEGGRGTVFGIHLPAGAA
jgi:signal transduction histidine kinase